jgi:type IV secretory pathway VirB6-like protein
MSANEIHQNDIGTIFKATIKDDTTVVDISSATTKQLIFTKPDGTKLEKDASFFTDGTDGILTYTTVSGDLSVVGTWKVQGYVILTSGTWKTDIKKMKVHRNL